VAAWLGLGAAGPAAGLPDDGGAGVHCLATVCTHATRCTSYPVHCCVKCVVRAEFGVSLWRTGGKSDAQCPGHRLVSPLLTKLEDEERRRTGGEARPLVSVWVPWCLSAPGRCGGALEGNFLELLSTQLPTASVSKCCSSRVSWRALCWCGCGGAGAAWSAMLFLVVVLGKGGCFLNDRNASFFERDGNGDRSMDDVLMLVAVVLVDVCKYRSGPFFYSVPLF